MCLHMETTEMKRRPEASVKLQLRITPELKTEVEAAAEELGQSLSTFASRALAAAVISFKAKEATT
jgi:predicted HicB family RNase H-like nuclease